MFLLVVVTTAESEFRPTIVAHSTFHSHDLTHFILFFFLLVD